MRVLQTYNDGSRTVLYEPGDRVRYTGPQDWFTKNDTVGTVLGYEPYMPGQKPEDFPYTTRLRFQPDGARDAGMGFMEVSPGYLELVVTPP